MFLVDGDAGQPADAESAGGAFGEVDDPSAHTGAAVADGAHDRATGRHHRHADDAAELPRLVGAPRREPVASLAAQDRLQGRLGCCAACTTTENSL